MNLGPLASLRSSQAHGIPLVNEEHSYGRWFTIEAPVWPIKESHGAALKGKKTEPFLRTGKLLGE